MATRMSEFKALYRHLRDNTPILKQLNQGVKLFRTRNRKMLLHHMKSLLLQKRSKTEQEIKQILAEARPHQKGIIVYAPAVQWRMPLYQRPQHLAHRLAQAGFLFFYCSPDPLCDQISGIDPLAENLYLTNYYDLVMAHLPQGWLYLHAGQPTITLEDLKRYKQQGIKIIYDYVDEIDPGIVEYNDLIPQRHRQIDPSCVDLVLTVSAKLYQEMLKRFPPDKVLYHPNGVEYEHFHIQRKQASCPEDLLPILSKDQPIIGYYGALAKWLDYELMAYAAQQRPHYQFVFIGLDFDRSLKQLPKLPNVHYLGVKHYRELPQYAIWFDVATIPFKHGEIAKATSPIKLYEYLALNKPVVATSDLIECQQFKGVFMATDSTDYLEKLDEALVQKSDPDYLQLLDSQAQANTWDIRASEIVSRLECALQIKMAQK